MQLEFYLSSLDSIPSLCCVCVCVCVCVCAHVPSVMSDSVTPWTADHQAPLSLEFSQYWNGLPFPTPEDLPVVGIKPVSLTSPALVGGFFITCTTWEAPHSALCLKQNFATTFCLEMMAQHLVPYATVSRLLLISISSARQPLCHLHQSGWRPGDSRRIYMVYCGAQHRVLSKSPRNNLEVLLILHRFSNSKALLSLPLDLHFLRQTCLCWVIFVTCPIILFLS